jgi:hypothetical protein
MRRILPLAALALGACSPELETGAPDGGRDLAARDAALDLAAADGCGGGVCDAAPPDALTACTGTLCYFGYWRDSDIQNYVCQIQDHANFSMTGDSQAEIDLAATYAVGNFGLLAPTKGGPPPLDVTVLRDDADASAYGWCAMNPCPNGIADGWAAVKAQIESDGDAVKAQHPNAHLMINLADGDANGALDFQTIPGFTLPRGVDWVGLECYTGAPNCQANAKLVEPLLPPGGRLWVIAAGTNGYGTEDFLVADAQANYDWASADPAVIGMMAFVWSNTILCPPDCMSLAVKEMPNLLAKFRQLGDQITGRAAIQPIPDDQCPPP